MEPSIQHILLSDREVHLGSGSDLAVRAHALLRQQKDSWPLLRQGYAALEQVQSQTIGFDGFALRVQWNPARIVSSSAKVDDEAIRQRKCFLCAANLPAEQRGLLYANSHLVLCNPFPIFEEHFTIPNIAHTPQRIGPVFGTMLDLAHAMQKRYVVSYNGPRSGASAPDHQHFQAGERGFLPLGKDVQQLMDTGEVLSGDAAVRVVGVDAQLRRFLILRSAERKALVGAFSAAVAAIGEALAEKDEPMLNILASFEQDAWTVLVFPRARHRPSVYFAPGDEKVLISPAAVDCGGVLTTPLERDFHRLKHDLIRDIFGEIFLPAESFQAVCRLIAGNPASHSKGVS